MAANIQQQEQPHKPQQSKNNQNRLEQKQAKRPDIWEVIGLSAFIIVFTLISAMLFKRAFEKAEKYKVDVQVKWDNKDGYELKSGPVWFIYDKETSMLRTVHPIDDKAKKELIELYAPDSAGFDTYKIAIDHLAFQAQQAVQIPYLLVLIIGGLAAVIGVQIRTIQRFVQHACVEYDLDIKRWWPWYLMRPFAGFLLGCAVILLAQVKLLSFSNEDSTVYFWIGLAILAGFGTPDVLFKLHQLSETLFGNNQEETTHPRYKEKAG